MIYGYDPAIVVASGRHRRVIRQRRPRTQLPLAPIVNVGGLRLEWFQGRGDADEVLQLLRSPLDDILTDTPRPTPQHVSRGFLEQDLAQIYAITDRVATTNHATAWFKVAKSSNLAARLVQDFSDLSSLLDLTRCRPRFPQIHQLIVEVLSCEAVTLGDFANWFYQIAISPQWGKYLQARIARARGEFVCVQLRVLSMGLGVSVFVAHTLAETFATESALEAALRVWASAWVDNLVGGGGRDQAYALRDVWVQAARDANIAWSEPPTVHEEECELLGLRFLLREKRVTTTETVKNKLRRNLESLNGPTTLRELLGVVGLILWVNFVVVRCPLAFAENLLTWLRRATGDLSELDTRMSLAAPVRDDITRMTNYALRVSTSLQDLTPPATAQLTLFSDASSQALAAVYRHENATFSIRSWPSDPHLTIFAKELCAHLFSIELVPRGIRAIGCGIDSTNTLSAIRRGHSSSPAVNFLLRLYYVLLELQNLHVSTAFIPSQRNLADYPSRLAPLPANADAFFQHAPPTTPLPFFAVPPWAEF